MRVNSMLLSCYLPLSPHTTHTQHTHNTQQDGTPAAEFPDQVPAATRQRRRDELVSLQQRLSEGFAESLVGRSLEVLVDGLDDEGGFVGRTQWDAPDGELLSGGGGSGRGAGRSVGGGGGSLAPEEGKAVGSRLQIACKRQLAPTPVTNLDLPEHFC